MGLIGTPKEFLKAVEYLKREFKIKHLGKTRYCLGLLIDYKTNEALIYQFIYVEKILKHFSMDNAHLLSTPIIVMSLDPKRIFPILKRMMERYLGLEVPYLNAIDVLLYLAQCI